MDRKSVLEKHCLIPVGRCVALVDREDFDALRVWKWRFKARRTGGGFGFLNYKGASGYQVHYLHHTVCHRAHGPRPSKAYACVAANGDYLDCRRQNLSWRLKEEVKQSAIAAGRLRARKTAHAR